MTIDKKAFTEKMMNAIQNNDRAATVEIATEMLLNLGRMEDHPIGLVAVFMILPTQERRVLFAQIEPGDGIGLAEAKRFIEVAGKYLKPGESVYWEIMEMHSDILLGLCASKAASSLSS